MRLIAVVLAVAALSAPTLYAENNKTYVGVITDTMCARNHKPMNVSPDSQCVKECVRDGKTYKYALADAQGVHTLSDQETPAQFAGQRVKVTGVLYTKTNILKVVTIAPAH